MVKLYKCKKKEFCEIKKGKKIVCFGAGEEFKRVCNQYMGLEKEVLCIVDNNKSGQYMIYNDSSIPIVSIDDIRIMNDEALFVISTIGYADQFVRQLDKIGDIDEKEVFIPYFFEDDVDEEVFSEKNKLEIIPRKIHYCWFGNGEMPDKFKKNIETWYKYCPDYEIIRWDESNYDIDKNIYMKQAYESKKWGFVPDYARLDIINTYGGIYLDTDVEMLKSWDNLLTHKMFCGFESFDYVALGLGFGGVSNNKILKEMIEQYETLKFIDENGQINLTASPVYQTEILKRHGLICNGKVQITDDFAVYSPQYFAPINSLGIGFFTEKSYSNHQYAASWFDKKDERLKNRAIDSVEFVKQRIRNYETENR